MYLNRLNSEQKELFLDLCIHAAMANQKLAEEEKEYIKLYCNEMQINDVRYEAKTTIEEAMTQLADITSETQIKIIVLELTALVISDHKYDEMESDFMNRIIQTVNIDKVQHKKMIEMLIELAALYEKFNAIIV